MIKHFVFAFGIFSGITALCQSRVDTLVTLLNTHQNASPMEKVYLHLDRPHYAPGDTLWFKAYLTASDSHKPDTISKNIYVDFLRKESGGRLEHLLLKNQNGYSYASIKLADTLREGAYEIVAYTQWMRNFSDQFFFHKEVFLRKKYEMKGQPAEAEIAARLEVADLQFFSEGGNLVAGLQNRVAFKAVNKFGLGVDVKAFVISSHGDTVASIKSQHLGMGNFVLKPKPDEKYFAVVEKSVKATQFPLPEAVPSGYTFFVDNLSSKDFIKVIARNNFPGKDRPILIGHQRGNIIFAFQGKTEENSFTWSLPKSEIHANGIVHLTLFTKKGIPQCERILYHGGESPFAVSISSDKTEYGPREKINLTMHVQDAAGNPVEGTFSMAVTDTQQVLPENFGLNIYNYLYLTSDVQDLMQSEIRGAIEQPDYYFNKSNRNAIVHLDMLLLTQGWRKFLWTDVISQKNPPQHFELERGIQVRGKAVQENGRIPSKPAEISLLYSRPSGESEYVKTTTDEKGYFTFSQLDATRETRIFIQGSKERLNRVANLYVENVPQPVYKPWPRLVDPFFLNTEQWNSFLEQQAHLADMDAKLRQSKAKMLGEVVIKAKREEKQIDSRKSLYSGTNMTTVKIENNMCAGASRILQMLQGRVAGLQISLGRNGDYVATIRGTTPMILVDGMRLDLTTLDAISPCSVESIDVINHPVAALGAPSLISILTKRANPNYDYSKEVVPGTLATSIQGYAVPRVFYSPQYPLANPIAQEMPDVRATLYWNPSIQTDSQGNAKVTFWNSDEQTSVRVSLEGLSADGKPAAATYNYSVK
jgi:hypothetical protein